MIQTILISFFLMNILPSVLNIGIAGIGLFVLALIIISVLVIWFIVRLSRKYSSIPTYDQYIDTYPESKTENGITCRKCGSTHMGTKRVCHTPASALFLHICDSCGTTLFRSKG